MYIDKNKYVKLHVHIKNKKKYTLNIVMFYYIYICKTSLSFMLKLPVFSFT